MRMNAGGGGHLTLNFFLSWSSWYCQYQWQTLPAIVQFQTPEMTFEEQHEVSAVVRVRNKYNNNNNKRP